MQTSTPEKSTTQDLVVPPRRQRIESLDMLRGLVMIVMALDHTRDFFSDATFDPTDLHRTYPALFLTRFVTHFCAPTFVLLAGVSAFLYGRGRDRKDLSRFLLTRGLWLIFLEFTALKFGWTFNLGYHVPQMLVAQVMWAIGVSMITLAGLVWLPLPAVVAFGLVMIVGHNALDGISPKSFGAAENLWVILHTGGGFTYAPGYRFFVLYPLIPWIGVMAVGYGLGTVYLWTPERRGSFLFRLGVGLLAGFLLVRSTNLYGDPDRWSPQASPLFTLFSFVNVQKYPPSLCFLLLTLGAACLALAALENIRPGVSKADAAEGRQIPSSVWERIQGRFAAITLNYGRTPLFYYLLHIIPIHALALLAVLLHHHGHWAEVRVNDDGDLVWPGVALPGVYLLWLAVVAALYVPCRWFGAFKARHRDKKWLSYL